MRLRRWADTRGAGRNGRSRTPVTPEVGRCGRRRRALPRPRAGLVRPGLGQAERLEPPTDFRQHSRGGAGSGARPHPDPPWCTRAASRLVPTRRVRGRGGVHSPPVRRAGGHHGVVAGLWTGLLAWPSLRVGRPGSGAWADPVGRPTAEVPVSTPETAADLRICQVGWPTARRPARLVTGRAHPVDTGVESVRLPIHSRG
jgi:hypothetical protein